VPPAAQETITPFLMLVCEGRTEQAIDLSTSLFEDAEVVGMVTCIPGGPATRAVSGTLADGGAVQLPPGHTASASASAGWPVDSTAPGS
jgi:hypothetical protein